MSDHIPTRNVEAIHRLTTENKRLREALERLVREASHRLHPSNPALAAARVILTEREKE